MKPSLFHNAVSQAARKSSAVPSHQWPWLPSGGASDRNVSFRKAGSRRFKAYVVLLLRYFNGRTAACAIQTSGILSLAGVLINRCYGGRTRRESRNKRTAARIGWRSRHFALVANQQGRLLEDRAVGENHDGRFFGVRARHLGDFTTTLGEMLASDVRMLFPRIQACSPSKCQPQAFAQEKACCRLADRARG